LLSSRHFQKTGAAQVNAALLKKIWTAFNQGDSPDWQRMPKVVSESCYHSSKNYSNKIEHFSGFAIDVENDGFSLDGNLKMAVIYGTLNYFILCDLAQHQN